VYYSAWKESFKSKKAAQNKRLNQINEEVTRRYEEKVGDFNLIFPFNKKTETLAMDAYKTQNMKNPTKPDYIRLIVNEVKACISDFNEELLK
jgi:hypothetical protein